MSQNSICFLLGAGFSANQGYPVGNGLNNLLLNCTGDDFSFHSSGSLVVSVDGGKPDMGYKTSYDLNFEFCKDMIQYFNSKMGYFHYEEFYDFIFDSAPNDPEVDKIAKKYIGSYFSDTSGLLFGLKNIFNQLVSHFIKDRNGKKFYDDEPHMGGYIFPGYTGILNCFKQMGKEAVVHIHTLNHDLFFERFNSSDWLQGNLSDGFEEIESPYFGELRVENRMFKCRIERYTGVYDTNFRLYKLHGSMDYAVYHGTKGAMLTPESYIKTRWGVGFSQFYKEVKENGKTVYERDWVNYHADFLSGTSTKIQRYSEPLLYKKLFELFQDNLAQAEQLIIVGYGGNDSEVNKLILENFDFKNKPSSIIDLYPGSSLKKLASLIGAKLIIKDLQDVEIKDLNSL